MLAARIDRHAAGLAGPSPLARTSPSDPCRLRTRRDPTAVTVAVLRRSRCLRPPGQPCVRALRNPGGYRSSLASLARDDQLHRVPEPYLPCRPGRPMSRGARSCNSVVSPISREADHRCPPPPADLGCEHGRSHVDRTRHHRSISRDSGKRVSIARPGAPGMVSRTAQIGGPHRRAHGRRWPDERPVDAALIKAVDSAILTESFARRTGCERIAQPSGPCSHPPVWSPPPAPVARGATLAPGNRSPTAPSAARTGLRDWNGDAGRGEGLST